MNCADASPHLAYADDVLSGKVDSCNWIRLACRRTLDDLERPAGDDWPFVFDPETADYVVGWLQKFSMSRGRGFQGRPLVLEPWQRWIVASVFGWVDRETGLRRFRYVYLEVPRKAGKSELAAAMALYCLLADGEEGAQVMCAASNLDQARILGQTVCQMARRTPGLKDAFGLTIYDRGKSSGEIRNESDGSFLKCIASDKGGSQDGHNVSAAFIDEVHAHKSRSTWDAMEFATDARHEPLIVAITTAGDNKLGIGYEQHNLVTAMLEGETDQPNYFGAIYTIDKEDEQNWDKPEVWRKANPNLGVSVFEGGMRAQVRKAKLSKSSRINFMLKKLNVWVNEAAGWLDSHVLESCRTEISWEQAAEMDCYMALDLSSKIDVSSMAYLFVDDAGRKYIKWRNYLPEVQLECEINGEAYTNWAEDGSLTLMPGARIDYDMIYDQLLEDCQNLRVKKVGYDLTHAAQVMNRLDKVVYVDLVEIPQTAAHLSNPFKELEADFIAGNVSWDGNPCSAWMLSNTKIKSSGLGRVMPFKTAYEKKIDATVAGIMAYKVFLDGDEVVPVIQSLYTDEEKEAMRNKLRH